MRDMFEMLAGLVLALVVVLVSFFGVMTLAAQFFGPPRCASAWGEHGRWEFWVGCVVKTNRGWLPEGHVRAIDLGFTVEGQP